MVIGENIQGPQLSTHIPIRCGEEKYPADNIFISRSTIAEAYNKSFFQHNLRQILNSSEDPCYLNSKKEFSFNRAPKFRSDVDTVTFATAMVTIIKKEKNYLVQIWTEA